ncbi:DUF1828 domain-containing protein [Lactiplantibacillus sp. WILCCON 0030]|uniref:DUF1828 domain-containing protein n=1 Tax=Lactiplantibacillus brownii TaxID=3069269 RepID=A0ABU1A7L4_9LACO|nr:DUF1828 domain-containing protein [Lactiplantibacillus brownii]MDQ7936936.1 DUF1828 domain-containing protein [Lactiplantibacillus brownii]
MSSISELRKTVEVFYKQNITLSAIQAGVTRIDTPFLDRHSDAIVLYAVTEGNNRIKLTDYGYVLDDLESDGVYLARSKKRLSVLKEQLNAFSVKINIENNELFIETSIEEYPIKQNLLIQAMLFTNDMFMLSNKRITSLFINEVATFFESHNIRVTNGPNIIGPSGMIHHYDFSIPGIRDIPEKLIKTMNTSSNEYYAKSITMDTIQTKETRPNTSFYAIINDEEPIDSTILNLFGSENIIAIPFSKRSDYVKQLAK